MTSTMSTWRSNQLSYNPAKHPLLYTSRRRLSIVSGQKIVNLLRTAVGGGEFQPKPADEQALAVNPLDGGKPCTSIRPGTARLKPASVPEPAFV